MMLVVCNQKPSYAVRISEWSQTCALPISSSACYRTFSLVMPRSPGFGSNASNSNALFRLAFAAPTPNGLSLLDTLSHRPIMQEVRCQASRALQLLVGIRFQVLFNSPHRGDRKSKRLHSSH